MQPFTTHAGKLAVLAEDNIDTDRIIPARYLTLVTRSGYGELLFHDVRNAQFPLDQPEATGASILVVGTNFGCGSSREHAVWAIQQAGFRAVIARKTPVSPGFSDIFRGNAGNCGMLLIELDEDPHRKLVAAGSGAEATIDLPNQKIHIHGEAVGFDVNPATKQALVEGLDLIGTTLRYDDVISTFEKKHEVFI